MKYVFNFTLLLYVVVLFSIFYFLFLIYVYLFYPVWHFKKYPNINENLITMNDIKEEFRDIFINGIKYEYQ